MPQPGLATQFPVRHCFPAPQTVLSDALPVMLQTCVPVAHEFVPTLQTVPGGMQEPPAVQPRHIPVLQTRLVPQGVPLVTDARVSLQIGAPVEQDCDPTWQGALDGVQDPAMQAAQVPLLQTRLGPHGDPLPTFPVMGQVCTPVAHDVTPVWQVLLAGVHGSPALQETHDPKLQTRRVPQEVPFWSDVPRSMHVGTPPVQTNEPAWHGAVVGVHEVPAAHVMQAPALLQTMFVPQEEPL